MALGERDIAGVTRKLFQSKSFENKRGIRNLNL